MASLSAVLGRDTETTLSEASPRAVGEAPSPPRAWTSSAEDGVGEVDPSLAATEGAGEEEWVRG